MNTYACVRQSRFSVSNCPRRVASCHRAWWFPLVVTIGLNAAPASQTAFNYLSLAITANAVAVDANGNTYITGSTGSGLPITPGAFQTQFVGGQCLIAIGPGPGVDSYTCSDAFAMKLDPSGNIVWATFLGGNGNDTGQAIAVDAQGYVYVAGTTIHQLTGSNTFPTTSGSVFSTNTGSGAFVVKLDPTGSQMVYGSIIVPGVGPIAMALDASGSVFLAGPSGNTFPTTPGAFQTSSSAPTTGVVLKLNAAGSALVYATYLGGNGSTDITTPQGIAVDPSGNAIVTGYIEGGSGTSNDFPTTPGALQTARPGALSAFVTKLNASGTGLIYSTYLWQGEGTAVRSDGQGRAYILGVDPVGDLPTTPGAFEPSGTRPPWAYPADTEGQNNTYLAGISPDGSSLVYSTYFTWATSLDVDASGNAYVGGAVEDGFPVSPGAFPQCIPAAAVAGVVAQFAPDGTLTAAGYHPGSFLTIAKGSNGLVVAGGFDSISAFPVVTSASFFANQVSQGGCAYTLQLPDGNTFGTFSYQSPPWIQHADLGYEYVVPADSAGDSLYLWDAASGHWFFTGASSFPFLYDFTLNAWLYYFPDPQRPGHYTTNPRTFANVSTGQTFTM